MSIINIFKKVQSAETRRTLHTHTHTHTSNLLLSIFLIIIFSFPSFATPDIPQTPTTQSCDDSILNSDTGPVNIEINWEPNHIELNWYEDSEATTPMTVGTSSQSCDYDGILSIPSPPSARQGYTFKGWRVRYTRLEYIESTGEQYIDFTNAVSIQTPITQLESIATVSLSNVTTTRQFIFSLGPHNIGHYVECAQNETFGLGYGGRVVNSVGCVANQIYNIKSVIEATKHTLYINDVLSTELSMYQSGEKVLPMTLFRIGTGNYLGAGVQIHNYKLYNSGNLVVDLIPVRRNSDNVVGMYDRVTRQFFTNAGTGTFIAGPAIQ